MKEFFNGKLLIYKDDQSYLMGIILFPLAFPLTCIAAGLYWACRMGEGEK